jgi:hypothetical protein
MRNLRSARRKTFDSLQAVADQDILNLIRERTGDRWPSERARSELPSQELELTQLKNAARPFWLASCGRRGRRIGGERGVLLLT